MKLVDTFILSFGATASVLMVIAICSFLLPKHGEVVYNCSIAEISPDFPPEVREQCRKLNAEKNI